MNKEELKIRVGKKVVNTRHKLGWSQSDLARACNKDRQAIEKIENGKVNPTLYSLYEVALALGTTLSKLLDFNNENA